MKKSKDTKQPKYRHSLANRLTWQVLLTLLIVMGIASYHIFKLSRNAMKNVTVWHNEYVLHSANEAIDRILSDVSLGTVNNVANVEEHLNRPDLMGSIMKQIVELNPHINCSGICFTENYYPEKGHWLATCARRNKENGIDIEYIGDKDNDYLKDKKFIEAMHSSDGAWSEPYFDCVDSLMPLVSYLMPIHDRSGRTVAVLATDLSLEWLSEKLQEIEPSLSMMSALVDTFRFGGLAYSFIIDEKGKYITHHEKERILRDNFFNYTKETPDTIDDHAGRLMTEGKEGYYAGTDDQELTIEGESVYLFYTPIKQLRWTLGIALPTVLIMIVPYIFAVVLLLMIIIAMVVVFVMSRIGIKRTVKPLKALATTAGEVAKGKFDTPLPVIKSKDEIVLLRNSFEEMQHSLTQYIQQLQTTTAQKATMESELNIAHNIQMSMLPKTFPPYPERTDIDIYGMLKPAKAVGGDLFDFYISDEKLFFCIGDVSGKGVPAALVMSVARSLFRNISAHTTAPEAIVHTLNNALADGNDTGMFVTLFIGVLDLKTGVMHYCNGGHNAPLIIGREVTLLPCESNVVTGIIPNWEFIAQETTLAHGSTILLFTDGLNEAENAEQAQFGDERICTEAQTMIARQTTSPNEIISHIEQAVHQFVGNAEQSDDLTMLAIRYN